MRGNRQALFWIDILSPKKNLPDMVSNEELPGSVPAFLRGGGEMGALMRARDWSGSPIGVPDDWPQQLKTTVRLILNCGHPMYIWWGPQLLCFYNDAYRRTLGPERHPASLGQPGREVWAEIWHLIGPQVDFVMAGQGSTWDENRAVPATRFGKLDEIYWTYSYSPIDDESAPGGVGGVLVVCTETTRTVLAERRQRFRIALEDKLRALSDPNDAIGAATRALGEYLHVDRVVFGEIEPGGETLKVDQEWTGEANTSAPPRYRLDDHNPEIVAQLRQGKTIAIPDVRNDKRTSSPAASIGAFVDVPLVKNGQLMAILALHSLTPRDWSADEIALSEEIAQRIWAATVRARSETARAESEARYQSMADSAPVMMWVTDPDGCCTHLNARWYEFTGQDPSAGEGFGWLDAVHPDDRPLAEQVFVSANAKQEDYRVDFRLRRADGVYRWTIDAAAARFDRDGRYLGYVGSVIDIDDRREAEARLRLSEEQLRLATEAAEVGLWDVDLEANTLFWPARVKAMFGISPDVPTTMADFYAGLHPEDRDRVTAAFAAASDPARRAIYDVEYRVIGKEDGIVRWIAAKGQGLFTSGGTCTRVIGTAIDITARKADEVLLHGLNEQLEQKVQEKTAERNRVWEMSRDLFAVMGFDCFLKAINPAWEATLGYDREALLAHGFPEQVHPDERDAINAMLAQLRRGETVERFESRLRHASGSWRWISWTLVPEGDLFYVVGRDISDAKHAAEELENAQEALRQSQKMEAMGQLTGGVAHDFNNLLTPIVGTLDLLQRRGAGGEREQRLIDGAVQSADRAKTLVQRLLAFARRQPLQASAVELNSLVTGMAELVKSTVGPQIRVVVEVQPDLPPAKADPNQLEMALLNLSVNARDAMPDGGTLRITSQQEVVRPGPAIKLQPGNYILLSVSDTGTGMDEETVRRAVEPFFSTKGIGKGTGLGLSMVHGLASQLGGALVIKSQPGLGSNMELWLPISDPPEEPLAASPPSSPGQETCGSVLLVDDEILVRMSTADMLEEMGYTVTEAASAEEALKLFHAGFRPDFLVTDHLMSGMNGTDLAHEIKALHPAVKILIISGYAESDGILADFPHLTKPFRNSDLADRISQLEHAN